MVMVYAGGYISGGHYNPAVSLAVWMRGRATLSDTLIYMVVQVVAALLVMFIEAGTQPPVVANSNIGASLVAEFLFTFALAYVVLNAATAKGTSGNSFYGLAIGFTLVVSAFSIGAITGSAINPAVAVGLSVMGISTWANIWIYLVAEFLGGAAAALLFRAVNPGDIPRPKDLIRCARRTRC
jgi:aquaporin Z